MAKTSPRLDIVRSEVRRTLDSSPAFRALPPDRRRKIAQDMVKVVRHMADDPGTVDFPEFVSGLIQSVFQSIVDASVQQMDAFEQLLEEVSQSVDQFAREDGEADSAARKIAPQRQQTLSTMVLMGINRIVVTNAKDDDDPVK